MEIWKAFVKGFAANLLGVESVAPRVAESGAAGEVIKEPPMVIDGRVMSADEFVKYVETLEFARPLPNRIFLHHTWKPTLETWHGKSTILGMKAYYEKQLWQDYQGKWHEGWTAGPHLFVANDGIWLFSDLRYDGVGAKGYNERSRHLEMVGDYDNALPSGAMLANTIAALGIMHERLGLDINALSFHRDVSTKTCPGSAVKKEWIIPQVQAWIEAYRQGQGTPAPAPTEPSEPAPPTPPTQPTLREMLTKQLQKQLVGMNPDAALAKEAQARGLLGALTQELAVTVEDERYVAQVFAEALIVPKGRWDQVKTLAEFEESDSKNA